MRDAYTIVSEGLHRYGGAQTVAGDSLMVCCPFHGERNPSCGVYMVTGMEVPFGFWHCFGCGEKGHWNKFAEKAGLEGFKDFQLVEGSANEFLNQLKKKENKMFGDNHTTIRQLMKSMNSPSYFPWDKRVEWRGFPGSIIHSIDGYNLVDRWKGDHSELTLFFPVKIKNKYYGGVRALLKKKSGRTSYVNTVGDWANDYGLFPYDYVRKMIKVRGFDFVVLVEGPRDALRLIMNGIPALSVLGANNFSDIKMKLVLSLGVETVYMMPDNDQGGTKMKNAIKDCFQEHNGIIVPKNIGLPKEKDDKGNLIKLDPMDAPKKIIKELRNNLKSIHAIEYMPRRKGWM